MKKKNVAGSSDATRTSARFKGAPYTQTIAPTIPSTFKRIPNTNLQTEPGIITPEFDNTDDENETS